MSDRTKQRYINSIGDYCSRTGAALAEVKAFRSLENLLSAISLVESDWDTEAVGAQDPNDRGLYQINKVAHPSFTQPFSPRESHKYALKFLTGLIDRYGELGGIAAYNSRTVNTNTEKWKTNWFYPAKVYYFADQLAAGGLDGKEAFEPLRQSIGAPVCSSYYYANETEKARAIKDKVKVPLVGWYQSKTAFVYGWGITSEKGMGNYLRTHTATYKGGKLVKKASDNLVISLCY